jgi:TPR repeat protein
MHWLGTLLAEGSGIEQDDTLAAEWISKAAAQDHPIAKAQMAALLPRAF